MCSNSYSEESVRTEKLVFTKLLIGFTSTNVFPLLAFFFFFLIFLFPPFAESHILHL
uniref:Uncharacterized protein n=1 Tax=Arundo donax TaxID=35708 RepID=A0A0A8YC53_ARUDO